jgi:hypothetical protein
VPFLTLIAGVALNKYLENKAKLVTYLSHSSAFILKNYNNSHVYTHGIVVRNSGKKAAHNVCIGHKFLPPDFNIFPPVKYETRQLPDSAPEIYIPILVPGEQITIQYLYFPPTTWDKINSYVKSDEGFATVQNVLPTPQPPKWLVKVFTLMAFIGLLTSIYLVIEIIKRLI